MKRVVRKLDAPVQPLPRKKRVAAYARVSGGRSLEQQKRETLEAAQHRASEARGGAKGKDAMLHSLSAQVSYYSAYIQRHADWQYMGVYADEALTGTRDNRLEFQRLMQDCRDGKIDMVLTKSISRFARNTVTLLSAVRELKSLNVDVYFEEQNIHSMSNDGELMLTILASYAQEESRAASENCKWRIRKGFERGETINWRVMYGYRITRDSISICEEEARVVRRIFSDYLAGAGVANISRALREANVPSVYGGTWSAKRVRDVLGNEKYAGDALLQKKYVKDHITKRLVINHGELPQYYAERTHPAIISRETFERAKAMMKANHEKIGGSHNTPAKYPFTSLIVCGNCGACFRRKMNHGKPQWICGNFLAFGKAVCPSKYVPEIVLERHAASVLGIDAFDPQALREQIASIEVPANNQLVFVFRDGRRAGREWQDRSRGESWTEEMRRQAAQRARRVHYE